MMLALWARAQTTYGAIRRLAEEPDGDSAAMLSRALFEGTIDAYWIADRPLKAQQMAAKSYRWLQVVIGEHQNERRLLGDPVFPIDKAIVANRAALSKQFGSRGQKHWTSLDLPARIRDVAAYVPQDYPGELDDRYIEDNQLANFLLHGGPIALNDRITQIGDRVTINVGPWERHLANALRHAYWSYYRLGLLMLGRRQPDRRPELEELYRHGWPRLKTLTEGSLKAAGRNAPCPCGSGTKTKDCHGGL